MEKLQEGLSKLKRLAWNIDASLGQYLFNLLERMLGAEEEKKGVRKHLGLDAHLLEAADVCLFVCYTSDASVNHNQ